MEISIKKNVEEMMRQVEKINSLSDE